MADRFDVAPDQPEERACRARAAGLARFRIPRAASPTPTHRSPHACGWADLCRQEATVRRILAGLEEVNLLVRREPAPGNRSQ